MDLILSKMAVSCKFARQNQHLDGCWFLNVLNNDNKKENRFRSS